MRAAVITLSLISAVALVVLGGFSNALSGFGFDVVSPYNDPARVVGTFIGDFPGFALALTGLGLALYDAARRGGSRWFIGLLVWPFVPLLAASLMFAGALAYPIYWFLPLAFLPLASLVYAVAAPVAAPVAVSSPASGNPANAGRVRYSVFVGILIIVALGGAVLLFPSPHGATAAPSGPPPLRVTQTSASVDCANGSYAPITLANTGAQTLQWTATSQDPNVMSSPPSGSLAPGASTTVTLSGKSTAPDVIVQFQSGGQTAGTAKFGCQPGAGK